MTYVPKWLDVPKFVVCINHEIPNINVYIKHVLLIFASLWDQLNIKLISGFMNQIDEAGS